MHEETIEYNRVAWNRKVAVGNQWTRAVSADEIARARAGRLELVLTPLKPVPQEWLGDVAGKDVLCLACGGGQQAPLLAAAGATVTTLDLSEAQLEQDRSVADREGLEIRLEQGDMRDLSRFGDQSFDLIFHPVSNCFIPDVQPVWDEAFRTLKSGGYLLSGFANPALYLFHLQGYEEGDLTVRYRLPYADEEQLSQESLAKLKADGEPLEFGHTLESQIGGQIRAGFHLVGFYEDGDNSTSLAQVCPTFMATRTLRPAVYYPE